MEPYIYELVITRRLPNPEYGKPRLAYQHSPEVPPNLEPSRELVVSLTSDEFAAVRKAALEAFAL